MAFHEVRLPARLAFGSTGGIERRTEVVTLASGFERRATPWAHGRRRYLIGAGVRSLDDVGEALFSELPPPHPTTAKRTTALMMTEIWKVGLVIFYFFCWIAEFWARFV